MQASSMVVEADEDGNAVVSHAGWMKSTLLTTSAVILRVAVFQAQRSLPLNRASLVAKLRHYQEHPEYPYRPAIC